VREERRGAGGTPLPPRDFSHEGQGVGPADPHPVRAKESNFVSFCFIKCRYLGPTFFFLSILLLIQQHPQADLFNHMCVKDNHALVLTLYGHTFASFFPLHRIPKLTFIHTYAGRVVTDEEGNHTPPEVAAYQVCQKKRCSL
jgi:hypothetical protein